MFKQTQVLQNYFSIFVLYNLAEIKNDFLSMIEIFRIIENHGGIFTSRYYIFEFVSLDNIFQIIPVNIDQIYEKDKKSYAEVDPEIVAKDPDQEKYYRNRDRYFINELATRKRNFLTFTTTLRKYIRLRLQRPVSYEEEIVLKEFEKRNREFKYILDASDFNRYA